MLLAVGEAASNAIEHPSEPHRGRGMKIIEAIAADGVTIDRGEQGTSVTILQRRGERSA